MLKSIRAYVFGLFLILLPMVWFLNNSLDASTLVRRPIVRADGGIGAAHPLLTVVNVDPTLVARTDGSSAAAHPSAVPAAAVPVPCLLTPVYSKHFEALAARIAMINRTNTGRPVKSIIVFDDYDAQHSFCEKFKSTCHNGTGFVGVNLKDMIGSVAHDWVRKSLFGGGVFASGSRDIAGCADTLGGGHAYQTLKKFYGAAMSTECSILWVTDAESVPYIPHDLHSSLMITAAVPFGIESSWLDEESCTNTAHNYAGEASCAAFLGARLDNISEMVASLWKLDDLHQIYWPIDQWWIYTPRLARSWMDFLESRIGSPFYKVVLQYRVLDSLLFGMMWRWAKHTYPSVASIRNIREIIRQRSTTAYEQCCRCSTRDHALCHAAKKKKKRIPFEKCCGSCSDSRCATSKAMFNNKCLPSFHLHRFNLPAPCSRSWDLISNACLAQHLDIHTRISILTDDLGIFAWSPVTHTEDQVQKWAALNQMSFKGHKFAWCMQNCFHSNIWHSLRSNPLADQHGLEKYKDVFHHTDV